MSKSRDIADSAATINFIDGVTSDVQTQLDSSATAGLATAGPITTPVVTANSIVATVSATLGAVGDVTITGGTADQYLQTDGSGNLSFADVAGAGNSVCATTFQSCRHPILNLSTANYFKIRATSNTAVDITGSGDSLTIDYLSNIYTTLSLPDNFVTDGATGNTITSLALNNRYKIEYKKVGDEYVGQTRHLGYYPTKVTKHGASRCQFPCGLRPDSTCLPLGGMAANQYYVCETGARDNVPVTWDKYDCLCGNMGQLGNDTARGGMDSSAVRTLTFCCKGKLYTIAPGKIACQFIRDRVSNVCCMCEIKKNGAFAQVYGYGLKGERCLHSLVNTYDQSTFTNDKAFVNFTCSPAWTNFECCYTNAGCYPHHYTGHIKPLGVSVSRDLLLLAEMSYRCCSKYTMQIMCVHLEDFMNGRYRKMAASDTTCLCNVTSGTGSGVCMGCVQSAWRSLTATPNYDFDKCTIPLKVMSVVRAGQPNYCINPIVGMKFCLRPVWPNGTDNGPLCTATQGIQCIMSNSEVPLGVGRCGDCCAQGNQGVMAMSVNGEYLAMIGRNKFSGHCIINQIVVLRDCGYNTMTGCNNNCYAVIHCLEFGSRYCGASCCMTAWNWDSDLCHLVHVPQMYYQCVNSYNESRILSRTTTGTSYVTSYCQCICTDTHSTACQHICNNIWPRHGAYAYCDSHRPSIYEVDTSTPSHCIYSGNASCTTDCINPPDGCGLTYDSGTCTWSVGTQNFTTTCGANVAPCILFGTNNCEQAQGMTDFQNLYKTANGEYMSPDQIYPLSNTELFSI